MRFAPKRGVGARRLRRANLRGGASQVVNLVKANRRAVAPQKRLPGGQRATKPAVYLTKRISEYFGSGQRSSATMPSSVSATSRTAPIAGMIVSRVYSAAFCKSP
jgi:hypothetical protein